MKRKGVIIFLYIIFLLSCFVVLNEKNTGWFSVIYLAFGFGALFFYNRSRQLFLSISNYLIVFYEFIVLLLVSNKEWMRQLLDRDYREKNLFVFLLFSAPTILYIADKIFRKRSINR